MKKFFFYLYLYIKYFFIGGFDIGQTFTNNKKETFDTNQGQIQDVNQGTLMNALLRGEITEEVEKLRWRTYKILANMNGLNVRIDEINNDEIKTTVIRKNDTEKLKKLTICREGNLQPFIYQKIGIIEDSMVESYDKMGEMVSLREHIAKSKDNRNISLDRDFTPKVFIEKYVKKIVLGKTTEHNLEDEFVIDFYVSKYEQDQEFSTKKLLNSINKYIKDNKYDNIFDLNEISFVTHGAIGFNDFHEFIFINPKLENIYEFDGDYVIRYNVTKKVYGNFILNEFIHTELEESYKNKAPKP